jgi:hypothetical protein
MANNSLQKGLFLAQLIVFSGMAGSQDLGAYSDYLDHFYIFDRGKSIQVEDLLVQSFAIGGTCVLYINNQGHLKLYEDGSVNELEIGGDISYYATDHLAAYSNFDHLKVINNRQAVTLSARCPVYKVEDSLIVFYDKNLESLRIYYNDSIEDIENGLIGMPISYLASGDNIVAYISSRSRDFKIYYRGVNNTILHHVGNIRFKAGKDVVAYVNSIDNTFHIFYQGTDNQVEDFPPKSFTTGDEFVAYVDNTGFFKVYYRGTLIEVSSFAPDGYVAEDNILLFTQDQYFYIFYKGQVTEVEGYVPRNFQIDWNTVAYLDNTNRIWLFTNGEKKFLVNDLVNSFEVYRDLIILNVKVNRNIIYYKGKFYEGVSF